MLFLIGCSNGSYEKEENSKNENSQVIVEESSNNEDLENGNGEVLDADKEERSKKEEKVKNEKELTEDELEKMIEEQPLKVISTNYIIQDEEYKALYPDMLQAIIENNSGEDIKDAVIAFAAWDENGLPLKIQWDLSFGAGQYIMEGMANDINLVDGATFGEGVGFSISDDMDQIFEFEAIVVSYETFEGETWKNELYKDFIRMYEGQKRK